MRKLQFPRTGVALIAMIVAASSAQCKPANITPGELALLPEYCPYSQSFPLAAGGFRGGASPGQRRWVAAMGDAFWAIHHYCWALVNANRAQAAGVPAAARDHLLRTAIADCHYVIENSNREFLLLPEILLRMAHYHALLREPVHALEFAKAAVDIKPDYWPAYLESAKVNISIGRDIQAIQDLEAGLKRMPDQPDLSRELARLRGLIRRSDPLRSALPEKQPAGE